MYHYDSKLVDSSRMIADIMVADITYDQARFDEMFEIALQNKYPLSMRAARIVTLCVLKHPGFIFSHFNQLLASIESSNVDGVKRCFLKILVEIPLPRDENFQGRLADITFELVANTKEAIAIRAFSIDILIKISKIFPELNGELIPLLENIVDDPSMGLRSKCRKILKELKSHQYRKLTKLKI
jgi:hypothetical protein